MGRVSIYTSDDSSFAYTESDFFIISCASVLQNETRFPDGIEPYAIVEFAGYVQAYFFRSDVLEENGFRG